MWRMLRRDLVEFGAMKNGCTQNDQEHRKSVIQDVMTWNLTSS